MIVVVQTDCANIQSVCNSLDRLHADYRVSDHPAAIEAADHLILPGVGHARAALENIQRKNLFNILQSWQKPLLGICLGMQILYESSEEGDVACLGLLPGRVKAIAKNPGLVLPHMGWNALQRSEDSPLLAGIEEGERFYFVHSYRAPRNGHVLASTQYGESIPAIVRKGNIWGTQFHPEKSGIAGQTLLRNFINL